MRLGAPGRRARGPRHKQRRAKRNGGWQSKAKSGTPPSATRPTLAHGKKRFGVLPGANAKGGIIQRGCAGPLVYAPEIRKTRGTRLSAKKAGETTEEAAETAATGHRRVIVPDGCKTGSIGCAEKSVLARWRHFWRSLIFRLTATRASGSMCTELDGRRDARVTAYRRSSAFGEKISPPSRCRTPPPFPTCRTRSSLPRLIR